jgi:ATP phosphoribosyltransferase regulatory subunit
MTHPIPPGTRDVLPDEMRELRRLQSAFAEVCEARGYGEVATPTIEYYEVLARGDRGGESGAGPGGASLPGAPIAYRFFDERGELLAMRSDMTIPIARLASSRFSGAELPLRFFYMGRAYRAIRPQRGQMREFMQLGVELIGAEAPGGTAEVVEVLVAALDAVGLSGAVVGLGDADLYRQLLAEIGVEGEARGRILDELATHDLVGLEAEVEALGLGDADRDILLRLPNMRGGAEVLDRARDLGGQAVERATSRLSATFGALPEQVASRVQLDLGLLRDLGYYTGAILEVYDPAVGHVLGGGGRYDELMGRFGAPLPAAGFGLYLERVHIAQAEEERIGGGS